MALRTDEIEAELARVRPWAQEIARLIQERDPEATLSQVYAGPDPGIWLVDAYVAPSVAEDDEFQEHVAEREVDIMVEHGVHLATLLLERHDGASGTPANPSG